MTRLSAPNRVSRPSSTSKPPKNSPHEASVAQNMPGERPPASKNLATPCRPGPPKAPNNFCEPCAMKTMPRPSRIGTVPQLQGLVQNRNFFRQLIVLFDRSNTGTLL